MLQVMPWNVMMAGRISLVRLCNIASNLRVPIGNHNVQKLAFPAHDGRYHKIVIDNAKDCTYAFHAALSKLLLCEMLRYMGCLIVNVDIAALDIR